MTLDKLLGANSAYLQSLSEADKRAFFAPYLTVTRPSAEMAKKMEKVGETPLVNKAKADEKKAKLAKLEQLFFEKTKQKLL